MNCGKLNEDMMKYFDNDMNDIEKKKLKQHLKLCNGCNEEFKQLSSIFLEIEEENIEIPADFEEQVMNKINIYENARKIGISRKDYIIGFIMSTIMSFLLIALIIELSSDLISSLSNFGYVSSIYMNIYEFVHRFFSITTNILEAIIKEYYYVIIMCIVMIYGLQKLLSCYLNELKEDVVR